MSGANQIATVKASTRMVGAASLSAVRTSGGLASVEWIGPGCSPIALHVPIECGGGKLSYVYVSASASVWSMVTKHARTFTWECTSITTTNVLRPTSPKLPRRLVTCRSRHCTHAHLVPGCVYVAQRGEVLL